ncbi:MAG: NADPH:quinone oxidoreductase family protein [Acidimicrobiia bacterium]
MRAARCISYGPPESVVVEDLPDPSPGPGEVVVDVHYAAVNFPDVLIVADKYQMSVPPPYTPGSEWAGVVAEVGEGVARWSPGDRVSGGGITGAFAERTLANEEAITAVPDRVDLQSAAAFSVAHTTAYHSLRTVGDVQPHDHVLVLGAAGGVGLAAVELGTVLGAQVIAAASSPEKCALCASRGAVATIDYSREDLKNRAKELSGGGVDVVIDPVGGPYSEEALRATAWGGRFVVVGFASGEIPRIPLNLVLLKGTIVLGFEIRTLGQHRPDDVARDRRELAELFAAGKITPYVSAVHPLEDTAFALRSMLERTATGKVLIDPRR